MRRFGLGYGRFQVWLNEGKRPVGVRLMPSEVTAVREYMDAVGRDAFLQPVGGGRQGPQILGMAIIEVARFRLKNVHARR